MKDLQLVGEESQMKKIWKKGRKVKGVKDNV